MTKRTQFQYALSRRIFLRTAAGAAAALATPAWAQEISKTLLYVGCYTGRGLGIYAYDMNPTTGALTLMQVAGTPATVPNPSFIALEPHGRFLYSVNEIGNFEARQSGSVSSFSVEYPTGRMTLLNSQPTEGRNPAHLSLDSTGRFVLAANYSGTTTGTNNIAVVPVKADGSLDRPTYSGTHIGRLGPNTGRQEAPHAHQILTDPSGQWVIANDLGLDASFVYRLNRGDGTLTATSAPIIAAPGAGPRHLAFHPNGEVLYIICELDSTIAVYGWDSERGTATFRQRISTLPEWYAGISTTAQVVVSADGRFVYGSNRGHDSIAIFAANPQTGELTSLGEQWTYGETPRNFNIDPSGNFMYVAHQNTDNIVTFRVNRSTGRLEFTGQIVVAGQPVCLIFHGAPAPGNTVRPGVTFQALRSPALGDAIGYAQLTLGWNAPGVSDVDIRIASANGPSLGRQPSYGTAVTGRWVRDGLMFFLMNAATGETLGTVRASVIQ